MLALLFALSPAQACGPWLNQALVRAPAESQWVAPVADFGVEMDHLAPAPRYRASDLDAIHLELQSLRPLGVKAEAWQAWREGLTPTQPEVPEAAPAELLLYAQGGAAWRRGDRQQAAALWSRLLDLPAHARPTRTLWATFMLAEYSQDEADFDRVLALVDGGAADPLGLATASLGEKARLRLWRQDWRGAVDLYLQQHADGEGRGVPSLRLVVQRAIEAQALESWAADPVLSRVATAWFLAHGGPSPDPGEAALTRAWLDAVEAAGVASLPEADHLAWIHYQLGQIPETSAWLDRAPPTALAHWLRGRLLLRAGDLAAAERELTAAATAFSPHERWEDGVIPGRERYGEGISPAREAWGDAGLVRLAREDWEGAADAFDASESWEDRAYMAERILDLPAALSRARSDQRYLLARRALRLGQQVNIEDFPAEYRDDVRRLLEARERASTTLSNREAARALWQAALITRVRGLEIMGTELDPDYALEEGNYQVYPPTLERFTGREGPLAATEAEEARWRASAPEPDQRWHYRFVAADLANKASGLLEDGDPDVGILLCRAARWVRSGDPEQAIALENQALRRTGAFFPPGCGDPSFPGELGELPAALGVALSLGALALWAGGARRDTVVP